MAETSPEEVLARIVAWLDDEPKVSIDEGGTVTVEGDPAIELTLTADDDRVVLTHATQEEGAGAARADQVIASVPDRGTSLHAAASVDRNGVKITLTNHVYTDGLSRQSFVTALHELVAAIDAVRATAAESPEDETDEEPLAGTKIHEPIKADTDTDASDETAVTEATPTWQPSHRAPAGGLRAWTEPDPSLQPVSRLDAGVELVVEERRGEWARVTGVNGWSGWVDARQLQDISEPITAPPTGVKVGRLELRPLPVVAALALVGSAFLPWVLETNSLDVPFSFLWDNTSAGNPQLGWILIGLGVITLLLSFVRRGLAPMLLLLGIVSIAISALFIVQVYRGVADFNDGGISELFEWLGFGQWVTLGAGVILLAAGSMTRSSKR